VALRQASWVMIVWFSGGRAVGGAVGQARGFLFTPVALKLGVPFIMLRKALMVDSQAED